MILSLAGLNIEVKNRYAYLDELVKGYTTESEKIDFSVSATDEDIEAERVEFDVEYSKGYLESIAIYRKIAERLPEFDAFVFHGAVISDGERAYAITANSGVGKTTHLRLWKKAYGDSVYVLNGDKPILRLIDGEVFVSGTPWRGKEGYGRPGMQPLSAVGLLKRAKEPLATLISPKSATLQFASHVYLPKDGRQTLRAFSTLSTVLSKVKFYEIEANMDVESALVSYKALTNK